MSPRRPSRALSKNAISSCAMSLPQQGRLGLRWVLLKPMIYMVSPPHRNWPVSAVLDSATWSSNSVLSFYLHDIQHEYDGILSLGPFVVRVRGSGNPHLFLTCSGEEEVLHRPCLRFRAAPSPASVTGCGACPSSDCAVAGVPLVFIVFYGFTILRFCFFFLLFYCVSILNNVPWGCTI